jgi:hypothetical protein
MRYRGENFVEKSVNDGYKEGYRERRLEVGDSLTLPAFPSQLSAFGGARLHQHRCPALLGVAAFRLSGSGFGHRSGDRAKLI